MSAARPVQAAIASAASFAAGGLWPLVSVAVTPVCAAVPTVAAVALLVVAVLGAIGALAGGAPPTRAAIRVVFWGALAMAVTFEVGRVFGTAMS